MDIDVTVTSHKADVLKALGQQVQNGLTAIGLTAEAYAKKELYGGHGVDTGRLRNSITYATGEDLGAANYTDNSGKNYSDGSAHSTPEKYAVYIGTNVEYAPYVEYGTSKMSAIPYLKPAATGHSDEYKKLMEAALKS